MDIQIVRISRVTDDEKSMMFDLLKSYFVNLDLGVFLADRAEKDWVIILREQEKIFGFSTIQVLEETVSGEPVVFVFSGDTIVDRKYWQSNMLAPAFGFFMLRMIEAYREQVTFWVSGNKILIALNCIL